MGNNALAGSQQRAESSATELLQRLRQTSHYSQTLLEAWLEASQDADIRSGLRAQIQDERRQVHVLSDAIKSAGYQVRDDDRLVMTRIFSDIARLDSDLKKLCAYHRGVKAFTLNRCSRLLSSVDRRTVDLIELVMQEDERHIRWADIRIQRLMKFADMRECNLLMSKNEKTLVILWDRASRGLGGTPGLRRRS